MTDDTGTHGKECRPGRRAATGDWHLRSWRPALCLQVLQGAQLIAVASSDAATAGVDGSPLQGSDIQVQYVQLAPVTDHSAAAQVGSPLPRVWAPSRYFRF